MNLILVAQIHIIFEITDFDKGVGNEPLGVVEKQQGSCALQQFPIKKMKFIKQIFN